MVSTTVQAQVLEPSDMEEKTSGVRFLVSCFKLLTRKYQNERHSLGVSPNGRGHSIVLISCVVSLNNGLRLETEKNAGGIHAIFNSKLPRKMAGSTEKKPF